MEVRTLSLEDLGRGLWTAIKILPVDPVVDDGTFLAIRERIAAADYSSVINCLLILGALEGIRPGSTSGWDLPVGDPGTVRNLIQSSKAATQGVPQALVVLALEHGRGLLNLENMFPNDRSRLIATLISDLDKAISPVVKSVLERAIRILSTDNASRKPQDFGPSGSHESTTKAEKY
jgi:hypothetical protein